MDRSGTTGDAERRLPESASGSKSGAGRMADRQDGQGQDLGDDRFPVVVSTGSASVTVHGGESEQDRIDRERRECPHDAPLVELAPEDEGHLLCSRCGKSFFTVERVEQAGGTTESAEPTTPASAPDGGGRSDG